MGSEFAVTVGVGSLRSHSPDATHMPHRWSEADVTIETAFTGAHLLHLAVAGCVLNDLYREATPLAIELRGVRVRAGGDFDRQSWQSTGITYEVELDSDAPAADLAALVQRVDEVAEIPQTLRQQSTVLRGLL